MKEKITIAAILLATAGAITVGLGDKCTRVPILNEDGKYEYLDIKNAAELPEGVTPIWDAATERSCSMLASDAARSPLVSDGCYVGDVSHPDRGAYRGRCCEAGCACVGACKAGLVIEIAGHEIGVDDAVAR